MYFLKTQLRFDKITFLTFKVVHSKKKKKKNPDLLPTV